MKKLRIGIAGLGRLGKIHAYNLACRVPNTELVAACATSDASLSYAKETLGVTNLYKSFDEFVNCKDMDAVLICTPSDKHCKEIELAFDKGLHVFTEKPLGVSVEDCKIAEAAVEKHKDLKFMIGFMRRFDKSYAYAKEKIKKGDIGTPYLVKCTSMDAESTIEGTIKYSEHSAGIFLDLGVHDIDLMHWFLESEATEVDAKGATFKYKKLKENGDEEAAIASYMFKNGAMGFLHVSRAGAHGNHVETEIVGTDGSIRIGGVPGIADAKLFRTGGITTECVEEFTERWQDAYVNELEIFADCVLNNKPMPNTVYDGTYAAKVGIATTESLKKLSVVKIN